MGRVFPKIGVFDSGIGGLTILRECFFLTPEAEYFYLGDNGRAPYGNRTEGEIAGFVSEAMETFLKIGADAVVLACNTATAVCIGEMRKKFPFPIVGTEPAVRLAATECRRALILSTVRTAESERLAALIRSCPQCDFSVLPCPDLAGEIELLFHRGGEMGNFVHLIPPKGRNYDGIVLGCTHYVFLKRKIAAFYGCKTYDGNRGVAEMLRKRLNLGPIDHPTNYSINRNQNICFEKNLKEKAEERVYFLGKSKDFNKSVFFSNICFSRF